MSEAPQSRQLDQETGNTPAPQHTKIDWSNLPENVFKSMEARTASTCAAYLLPTLKEMKAENPQLTLLDVGAGSGSISAEFAQLVGPNGHVTAVDLNPGVIPRAKVVAEQWRVSNISFQTADAYKLAFDDETFDIVHCHQVLVHCKNPWEILREMLRVTKLGGVVAAREGDLETEVMWPPLPGLLKFHHDFEVKLITDRGGHKNAGRQLLSWALRAGAKRDQITTSFGTWTYTEPEDRKMWATSMMEVALGPMLREKNVKAGVAEAEMDEMREAWAEWMNLDEAVMAQLHGEVVIRK
ncbi:S-adenosyl-L-methionine-dependent methyltransferase [Mollisia scopiformis]|uniref:S-adenosyl-L-methionine-dependent methyltransferase n=1 Tax=Mollisia scopiformis TaxID=149040 RepID=A0A194X992_MOLSC|nr:S-adenosyl-L-methionine-dependent methyltransferase [Mollisia scopiformis]KUJ16738.1 S-adenosyl-L-methionine-dependent methyltransferase [Mollisia scopiformis]